MKIYFFKILFRKYTYYDRMKVVIKMKKVLFICHGNICRSTMAEMILKDKIKKLGLEDKLYCYSKAVSREEIGNPIYPKALRTLIKHNIENHPHFADQYNPNDYDLYDYILCMDHSNLYRLNNIKKDVSNKYKLLLSFTGKDAEISDPWYTDNFELCFNDLVKGIDAFLEKEIL